MMAVRWYSVSLTTSAGQVFAPSLARNAYVLAHSETNKVFLTSENTNIQTYAFRLPANAPLAFVKDDGYDTRTGLFAFMDTGTGTLYVREDYNEEEE